MNNGATCNTSPIHRQFSDTNIFNTLTCNRICIPLNFFLPKPMKFKKLYHRKVSQKNKSQLSLPKTAIAFNHLYSIPNSSRHKETTDMGIEDENKKKMKEYYKDINNKKTCRTECRMRKVRKQMLYRRDEKKGKGVKRKGESREDKQEVSPWGFENFRDVSSFINDSLL